MSIILVSFFLFLIFYAFIQRDHVKYAPWAVIIFSSIAIHFVMVPEDTTAIAKILGVGRGADLLLYLWFGIGSLIIFFISIKIRYLHEDLTSLARAFAIDKASKSDVKVDN